MWLTWCPQAVLSLTVLGEAGGEHQPVLQIHRLGALGPLVRHGLLLHVAVARVHAADLLVFAGECLLNFTLPELVLSACWNWDGSEVLFTCKDRKIRRVDPRDGNVEEEAVAHEGSKGAQAVYLKNGLVFTTGFTKHSERQYSLRAPGDDA